MCKNFSHLSLDELNKVNHHLDEICQILNPYCESISTLMELGCDMEVKLELLQLEVFFEICKKERA